MRMEAIISDCKKYRYSLLREWDQSKPKVLFIMLNPSWADSEKNDPTTTRCINYAFNWGYGGMFIGNIFAYRARDPKILLRASDPVGPMNDYYLREMQRECDMIIAAWGNEPILKKIPFSINAIKSLFILDLTKSGTPRHPLYLKSNLEPKFFQ